MNVTLIRLLSPAGRELFWGAPLTSRSTINAASVVAVGIRLKGPAIDRNDKTVLTATLRKYVNSLSKWPTRFTESTYEDVQGLQCLKYSGAAKKESQPIPGGEVKELPVTGYFCLHPNSDRYAVIMESHNYSTSGTKISFVDDQANHFFKSLRFAPVSSATTRVSRGA
jgi:hypothetical protein